MLILQDSCSYSPHHQHFHFYSCLTHCLCNDNFYTRDGGVHFISNNIAFDAQQLRSVAVQVFVKMIIGKVEITDCRCDPLDLLFSSCHITVSHHL